MRAKPLRQKPLRQHTASKSKARAIGAFIPDITKRAFQKYGFSAAAILTDWPTIIGADLAAVTCPERLKWPRRIETSRDLDAQPGNRGATLVLRTEPSRALDVQYQCSAIRDRINAYFGYCAVSDIRLLQAPLNDTQPPPEVPASNKPTTMNAASDSALRHDGNINGAAASQTPLNCALARLESNICGTHHTNTLSLDKN